MYVRSLGAPPPAGSAAVSAAAALLSGRPAPTQAQIDAAGQAAARDAAIAAAQAQTAITQPLIAYQNAISKLKPSWAVLPLAPYPPSGDSSSFPRTGSPILFLSPASVSAAQLAEPGRVTQALAQEQAARIPKLNIFFVIGAAAVVGYFVIR